MFAKEFNVSDKAQEASYDFAETVARKMKSHIISKNAILPE